MHYFCREIQSALLAFAYRGKQLMFHLRLRRLGLSASLVALAAYVMVCSFMAHRMDAADSKESKLDQLLQEKLSLLEDVAAKIDAKDKAGVVGIQEVYQIHQAVEQARLALCKSDEDRIGVMERMVAAAKIREEKMNRSPIIDTLDKIKSRVDRLDLEIALERIRSN